MTVKVPSTGYAQPLVDIGDGPSLIINRDLVTPLYLGEDNSQISNKTIVGDPNISIVDPLGSIAVDGRKAVYGFAGTGSIEVDIKKGAVYWAPSPAQVAAQINALGLAKDTSVNNPSYGPSTLAQQVTQQTAIPNNISTTGAPLLNFKQLLASGVGVNIPANTNAALGSLLRFNQPGYEIYMSLKSTVNPAVPYQITLTWLDSTSNTIIRTENYFILPGADPINHIVIGDGPTKGDSLSLSIFNTSATTAGTLTYYVFQHSRPYTSGLWMTSSENAGSPTFNGFTFAANAMDGGYLAGISAIVAHGGITSTDLLLPLYTGTIDFKGFTSDGTAGNGEWQIIAQAIESLVGLGDKTFVQGLSGQTGYSPNGQKNFDQRNIAMPNAQCLLRMFNHNATTDQTMTADIIARSEAVT